MKFLIVLSACLTFGLGEHTAGFRIRWTVPTSTETTGYFIDVPRDISEVGPNDWTEVTRLDGLFKELSMYCYKTEVSFCAFYDAEGHVRGFQVALLQSAYTGGPVSLDKLGFSSWRFNYHDYWTMQQFFIDDITQTSWDSSKLLQQNAVYVPTPSDPSTLMEITTEVSNLDPIFSKQGCYATTGTYYFYDITKNCDNLLPWFALYDGEELVSTGWWLFGGYSFNTTHLGPTVDVLEYGTYDFVANAVPNADDCFLENFNTYGIIALHVFYIEDYENTVC